MGGKPGRHIKTFDKTKAIQLIKDACDAGAKINASCKELNVSIRTYQRWLLKDNLQYGRSLVKRAPANKLTEAERKKIIDICVSSEYRDLPASQIVPRLADLGCYIASEATFYRVLKQHNLDSHRGKSKPRIARVKPELMACMSNMVWSWDITFLQTTVKGLFYYLYLIMDLYSRKIVGFDIFEQQLAEYSAIVIQEACKIENISASQLILHSDNGSAMKGSTMLATLQKLGVIPSFSRAAVSNDNAYSEALFRTLKYCPQYPIKHFESVGHAKEWVTKFVYWYNNVHLHSGIRFITPNDRHQGLDRKILANRVAVYESAKLLTPNRWSSKIRNWSVINRVYLNNY